MKKLLVSLLAVAAMASCSKSETESAAAPETNSDLVEILVKSTSRSIDTRAPFEGTISGDNQLTARVIASATSADYTTPYKDGQMTFADNGTTQVGFSDKAYYPVDGSTLYLCGLYPAGNWQNVTKTAEYTFDGKTDIMAAAEVSSSKSEAQGGTYPTLAFKHLLTKLVIKAKAEDQAAIDAWGKITEITLTQAGVSAPYNKATVTLADGTAATGTAFSNTPGAFAFYTMTGETYNEDAFTGQAVDLTTDGAKVAYSLVAPVTATGTGDFKLKIKTQRGMEAVQENEVTVGLQKTEGGAFEGDTQGKSFEITLTFKATEIQAKATVAAWEEGGSANADIQ